MILRVWRWYSQPRQTLRRILDRRPSEPSLLAMAMAAGLAGVLAQVPALRSSPTVTDGELAPQEALVAVLTGQLLAGAFLFPLFLYAFAAVLHLVARVFGGAAGQYGARVATVWTFFAAIPISLTAAAIGFVSDSLGFTAGPRLGLPLFAVFLWHWASHMAEGDGYYVCGRGALPRSLPDFGRNVPAPYQLSACISRP